MVRLVAIAFLVAIAAGVYAFMQMSAVNAVQLKLANTEQELATWKKRGTEYTTENKSISANLEQCNVKVTELTAALESATAKKPAAKR